MADLLAGRYERCEEPLLAPRTRVKDDPVVLSAACSVLPLDAKRDGSSFNIQIPLQQQDR